MFDFFKKIFPDKYDLSYASKEFSQELLQDYNRHRPLGPQKKLCYAPFKNIYFGHYGKATACCYNRDYVIGTYPKQSIEEIWFSKEANELRTSISKNNLDFGCELCKTHILSKNFEANKAKQYDEQQSNSNNYPSVIEFELNNTCNLECTMCNGSFSSLIRKNREGLAPLPQIYDDNFVSQLEKFIPYLEEVKFYGGEPFLIEIYYQIWDRIIEINPSVRISVQTNGTILNKRTKEILEKANFHINISIDALQKESYEAIRLNAKHSRVMDNIKWFHKYCLEKETFFGISACLMQENALELPDFIDYCQELDCPIYFHFVEDPIHKSLRALSKEALTQIFNTLDAINFKKGTLFHNKNVKHYKDTLKQISYLLEEPHVQDKKIGGKEDFKLALLTQIEETPYFSIEEKVSKKEAVATKIEALYNTFEDKSKIEHAFSLLNFNDAMASKQAVETFETNSVEDLIKLIEQYINHEE